ncbi:hypothetical protein NQZ68_040716 [Dissostichus eleginoides]|nr:hypothetical protein NQZ68_040716 [Dissostichus eleginoides]
MPLDVRGCTRATLSGSACVYPSPRGVGNPLNPTRDRDWGLQLFPMNEEFPVSAGHKLALIKSLPFVHTARRYYRLDGLVRSSDRPRRDRSRSWRSAEKTIKLDYLEEVNLRKDHYRFSPSIRGERNKQKPKPRGGSEGRALAVSAASASLFSPSPRRARAPAVKRQVARAPTATDSEPRLPSGTFSPAVHRQMKNTHLSASSKGRGNRAGGSAGGSRRCGAAAPPWPSAVRLRVPDSPASSGGRREGFNASSPRCGSGRSGTERPEDTLIIDTSNAPCGPGFLPGLRLSEGRFAINRKNVRVSPRLGCRRRSRPPSSP